ncbi:MAG: glycoside hydrolase family 3 N-terminal domain-containing protein [Ignavibacteria bacterium]
MALNKIAKYIIIVLLFVVGCKKEEIKNEPVKSETSKEEKKDIIKNYSLNDFINSDSVLNSKVDNIFNSLNDTERVAQIIMTSTGVNGKPLETVRKLVLNKKIGGVIIMGGSKDSFKSIILKLDSAVKKNNSIPMFYSVDAEPGFVGSRISGAKTFPPQSTIKSSAESDSIAGKISRILMDIGLNINFAPVCDISVNKEIISDRSFGNDSKKIIDYASAFIKSTQNNNIIATAKHFPGHGNVKGDSHKEMVFIDGKLTELETFKEIINNGVDAVMVGHIAVKNNTEYDTEGLPASLSKKIVTDLLRNKLGFKGLIITDALNMGAVTKIDKPALKAALAGCDILLMPTDEVKLINSILAEMNKNQEFKNQVYDSVKRIIRAKICLGIIK